MRLIDLSEELHDAYENAVRAVTGDRGSFISSGTRYATRLLLEDLQNCDLSCTQDERPLRDWYWQVFYGIVDDWKDMYEGLYGRNFEELGRNDPLAEPILIMESLMSALLGN